MAGELVPLVMLPRYTVLAGEQDFTTIAMDVTEYQNAILNVWRGFVHPVAAGPVDGGTFEIRFEESTDQVAWSECTVTATAGPPWDPTANNEAQFTAALRKRWFRIRVTLGSNDDAYVSTWAVGFLEQRER